MQANHEITLSLLVPAHSAEGTLPQLVKMLLSQSYQTGKLQIVISSDDGFDYSTILPVDPRIVFAASGVNTGPANARNRALKAATGTHVCMMDADDSVCGLFLEAVMAGLATHKACAVRSVYIRDGQRIKAYTSQTLTLDSYCRFYGSIIVAAPRRSFPMFQNVVVEDGVATLAVVQQFGGTLPVVRAEYRINLHPDSYCATNGHTFTKRYTEHLMDATKIAKALGEPDLAPYLERMYASRLAMSKKYDAHLQAGGSLDYHDFVASAGADESRQMGAL